MNLFFWRKPSNISEPVVKLNQELKNIDNWIPVSHRSAGHLKHVSKDLCIYIHGESWMTPEEQQLISATAHKTYETLWYNIQNKGHQEKRNFVTKELGL